MILTELISLNCSLDITNFKTKQNLQNLLPQVSCSSSTRNLPYVQIGAKDLTYFFGAAVFMFFILYSPSCPTPTPCYYYLIFTFLSYSHSMLLSSYIHLLVLLPLHVLIILYSPSCPTPTPCSYHLIFTFLSYSHSMFLSSYIHLLLFLYSPSQSYSHSMF